MIQATGEEEVSAKWKDWKEDKLYVGIPTVNPVTSRSYPYMIVGFMVHNLLHLLHVYSNGINHFH